MSISFLLCNIDSQEIIIRWNHTKEKVFYLSLRLETIVHYIWINIILYLIAFFGFFILISFFSSDRTLSFFFFFFFLVVFHDWSLSFLSLLSFLVLLKDFLPALRMYAPLFSSLSTAVAIAVVRSSNNHKKKEKGASTGSHSLFYRKWCNRITYTHTHGIAIFVNIQYIYMCVCVRDFYQWFSSNLFLSN
jgi:hypothetical protein